MSLGLGCGKESPDFECFEDSECKGIGVTFPDKAQCVDRVCTECPVCPDYTHYCAGTICQEMPACRPGEIEDCWRYQPWEFRDRANVECADHPERGSICTECFIKGCPDGYTCAADMVCVSE